MYLEEVGVSMENIVNLCIDSYSMERQCGRLYHQYTSSPVLFGSLFEALDQMDRMFDRIGFPQAATRLRSFLEDLGERTVPGRSQLSELPFFSKKEVKTMKTMEHVIQQRGTDATFLVRVMYRQDSDWQGEVTWVDGRKKECFRSALELIKLLDSALGEDEKRKSGSRN